MPSLFLTFCCCWRQSRNTTIYGCILLLIWVPTWVHSWCMESKGLYTLCSALFNEMSAVSDAARTQSELRGCDVISSSWNLCVAEQWEREERRWATAGKITDMFNCRVRPYLKRFKLILCDDGTCKHWFRILQMQRLTS